MKPISLFKKVLAFTLLLSLPILAQNAKNPIIWADVPDPSMIRVGDTYYMVSTTMHMSPGIPIMKSTNLVNWTLVNYAYDRLAENNNLNLTNGGTAYGKGSWASSIQYKNGTYYIHTFSYSTNQSHMYKTTNIENGPYTAYNISPLAHDASLLLDDDGRNYLVYGHDNIEIREMNAEATAFKSGGLSQVIINKASSVAGTNFILTAEGTQMFKINGYYYVMNICWPSGSGRTAIIHRSRNLTGPYEGRVILNDQGVAQGGLISTPAGKWYAYLFKDNGSVGRIPYLVPVTWTNDWPVLGTNGKVPATLDIPLQGNDLRGIVASDNFETISNKNNGLRLEWQWNHNPVKNSWSLTARPGFVRITNNRTDANFIATQNTLTQRSIGPESIGSIAMETAGMKDGDVAGLGALQYEYGYVAVKMTGTSKSIVMVSAKNSSPTEVASVPLNQNRVYFRIRMDFNNQTDKAYFYYSLDGTTWTVIGSTLQMTYKLEHFMGYRFALFNYGTKNTGGYADFDHYIINNYPFENAAPPTPQAVPGKIEAESFTTMNGIQTEPDAAGSINVGFINPGDWTKYLVRVQESGNYRVKMRVASGGTGDHPIVIKNAQGTSLGTVTVKDAMTDGWHDWYEDSTTIALDTGTQELMLEFGGTSEFLYNIDWMDFRKVTDIPTISTQLTMQSAQALRFNAKTGLLSFTAPVGNSRLEIFNFNGVRLYSESYQFGSPHSLSISLQQHGLSANSTYLVVLSQNSTRIQSKKLFYAQ